MPSEFFNRMRYAQSVTPPPERITRPYWMREPTYFYGPFAGPWGQGAGTSEEGGDVPEAPTGTQSQWQAELLRIGKGTASQLGDQALRDIVGGNLLDFFTRRSMTPGPAAYWALGLAMKREGYQKVALGGAGYEKVLTRAASYYRVLTAKVNANILEKDVNTRLQRIGALGSSDVTGKYDLVLVDSLMNLYITTTDPQWKNYTINHPLVVAFNASIPGDIKPPPKEGFNWASLAIPLLAVGAIFVASKYK